MMGRPNSFVFRICIIWLLFNYSTSAKPENFDDEATTIPVNRAAASYVPSNGLIENNKETSNAQSANRPDGFDYAQNGRKNETSQRFGDDIVSLTNDFEKYYENSQTPTESEKSKRSADPQDLCDTNECKCKVETKFLTVECYFQQDYSLDVSKTVRQSAETLLITLSTDSKFTLDANVFTRNRLNRIMINGGEHVEIKPNAFYNNSGPFPEIEIINAQSVELHSNAFYFEFRLNITNCAKVTVNSEAFANTVFHGYFDNIRQFQVLERGFAKSNSRITISNSGMETLNPLHASLKEIKFSNTHIGTILKHAFNVLKIDSIIFENCHIGTIQAEAFTEKLQSNQLSLTRCRIEMIESKAVAGSGISDVVLSNNSITEIKGNAIKLTSVNSYIQGNNIILTEIFWFRIEPGWSNVIVENNHFGDFDRMGVETTSHPEKCTFENNYITQTKPNSLNFKDPHCRVKQVSFDRACSCNSTYFKRLSDYDISEESYCKIDSTLEYCFNATLYNVKSYKDEICSEDPQIDCIKDRRNAKSNGYFIDLDMLFNRSDKLLYVYLGVGVLLVVVIIFLFVLIIRRCMKSKKDVIDDGPTRDIMLMESLHPTTATLTTQLYRQAFSDADIIIITQTLKEMKAKYPPEFYDQVDNNTRKLINGNLTETDKVKTIGEIVQCLNECETADIDFIAFTDILYNHLGAGSETMHTNRVSGPIYAEPGLAHLDIVNSTNGGRNNQNFMGDGAEGEHEHIYAEPINLQQPLLRNEYHVPIDQDNISHMYTEPVTGAIDYVSSPRTKTSINKNFDPSHLYAQPSKAASRSNQVNCVQSEVPSTSSTFSSVNRRPKISCLGEKFKNSAHSSSQESTNSHSDHSGASGVTLPLDEQIEYADA